MKKITILILIVCLVAIGCVKSPGSHVAVVKAPTKTQKYIGSFRDNVSIYRKHGDTIEIQKEQDESFDVYKLDMNTAKMNYEYTAKSEEDLLFFKQLSNGSILQVKRLGNREEDNKLVLKGDTEKTIDEEIAYSDGALVSTSPSERYIVYCAAEPIVNHYGLYAYDTEESKVIQLIGTANEELLNDLDWNISWSPKEDFIVVSDSVIVEVAKGSVAAVINASMTSWSPTGSKIAYIKKDNNGDKALRVLDLTKGSNKEAFVCSEEEHLAGYMVWNSQETKLAIATTAIKEEVNSGIYPYKAVYSLDLETKEAKRIDTALELDERVVALMENMQYNDSGSLLSITCSDSYGSNLYVYNLNNGDNKRFGNIEYLHHENNEHYVCSSKNQLYFVQGDKLFELNESMEAALIKEAETAIDDIYISQDGTALVMVESHETGRLLRQIVNFSSPI